MANYEVNWVELKKKDYYKRNRAKGTEMHRVNCAYYNADLGWKEHSVDGKYSKKEDEKLDEKDRQKPKQ